jgi:hypothetical protein
VIEESDPKETRKMVSNLSETLKKAYDDAVIVGEVKGNEQGAEQAKQGNHSVGFINGGG